MNKPACPRLWQVEALRDARLSGRSEREALLHVDGCEACQAEFSALNQLASKLRVRAEVDEVALRRLRQRVLVRADAALCNAPPAKRTWKARQLVLGVVVMSLMGTAAWGWMARSGHGESSWVHVQASSSAVWTRTATAGIEYVDLADGMLSISVRRPAAARLIVRVPDGQIEDTGTRFRVWVSQSRTLQIAVTEGSVVFRRAAEEPVVIRANSVWNRADHDVATPVAASAAPAPSAVSEPRAVDVNAAPARTDAARRPKATALRAPAASTDEDLEYLHIVDLLRDARKEEATRAAQAYLQRFPDGFRRVEVAAIAGSKP